MPLTNGDVSFEGKAGELVDDRSTHLDPFSIIEHIALLSLDEEFEKLLQRFQLPTVSSVCDLLLCSGAVISGSAALALLFPTAFEPQDLDIYVASYGAARVISYLEEQGYKIDPIYSTGAGKYDNGAVVFRLFHLRSSVDINVVIYHEKHFVDHIIRFHSTIVMNYVSWYGLVCLYPQWTLRKKGLINVDNLISRSCFTKYANRGFALSHDNRQLADSLTTHFCEIDAECPKTTRCLHDDHCAFQPFEGYESRLLAYEGFMTWNLDATCSYAVFPVD